MDVGGASYWNPSASCYWLRTSWIVRLAQQVLLLLRFAAWAVASAIAGVATFVVDVLYPLALWLWTQASAFFTFYFGLLILNFSIELILFAPVLLLGSAWLWWLFWPSFGCWLEDTYPIFRLMIDFTVAAAGVLQSILAILIRLWNTSVVVLGIIVNFAAVLLVEYYRFIALLIGELNLNVLFDAMSQLMVYFAELTINLMESFVSMAPTILDTFSTVMGPVTAVLMETAPKLLNITVVVLRILPATIGPILGETARVVNFVIRTFFKRDLAAGSTQPGAENPFHSREQLGLWRAAGELRSAHWTPETAQRGELYTEDIAAWSTANPLGTHSSYYLYHNSIPQRRPADVLADERNRGRRSTVVAANQTHEHRATSLLDDRLFATHDGGAAHEEQLYEFEAQHQEALLYDHRPLPPHRLNDTSACRSRFCGGRDARVPHALHTIGKTHRADRSELSRHMAAASGAEHRERQRHAAATLHATRKALGAGIRHLRRHGATMRRHLGTAWRIVSGHADVHGALEAALTKHPDPMDSLLSHTPVLSDMWPFNVMVSLLPEEERDAYWGPWIRKRALFYADVRDPDSGEVRRLMHVSVDEMTPEQAHRAFALRPIASDDPLHSHVRRQAGLGQGAMRVKYGEPLSQQMGVEDPALAQAAGGEVGAESLLTGLQGAPLVFLGGTALGFGPAVTGPAALGVVAGAILEPALPALKVLYTRDCFSVPKHPWCIPEIPRQLYCLFVSYVRLIPRNLPVRLCKYEKECKEIGFCIHPRPAVAEALNLFGIRQYLISWCWIQNMAIWFVTAAGLIFPVIRLNLLLLAATVPILGPALFKPLALWVPEPISQQDSVCLLVYVYAPLLFLVTVINWRGLWALVQWLYSSFMSLVDLISAARAVRAEEADAVSQQPWYQAVLARRNEEAQAVLADDAAFSYLARLGRPSPLAAANLYPPTPEVTQRPPGSGIVYTPAKPDTTPDDVPPQDLLEGTLSDTIYSMHPMPSMQQQVEEVEARIGARTTAPSPMLAAAGDWAAAGAPSPLLAAAGAPPPQPKMAHDAASPWHAMAQSTAATSRPSDGRTPHPSDGRGARGGAAPPERAPTADELARLRATFAAETALFGTPPDGNHMETAFDHAERWHPLIHSAHYSASWLRSHYLALHPDHRPGVDGRQSSLRYTRSAMHLPE